MFYRALEELELSFNKSFILLSQSIPERHLTQNHAVRFLFVCLFVIDSTLCYMLVTCALSGNSSCHIIDLLIYITAYYFHVIMYYPCYFFKFGSKMSSSFIFTITFHSVLTATFILPFPPSKPYHVPLHVFLQIYGLFFFFFFTNQSLLYAYKTNFKHCCYFFLFSSQTYMNL